MGTLETLNQLVSVEEIHRQFPKLPKPKQVKLFEIKDSVGEDAYEVVLVYPDSVTEGDLDWVKLHSVVEWIRDRIFENRTSDRWPYFRLGRESDFKQAA
jgi:hypothetical protein